ncbi:quercetin dioxygenase-like cupin family protein [Sinorhizobium fredii]|jgi:quercetin dioxygenase-like cupin family protein|uniref:Cupin 2, conserved barrel domain protein n=2 Tax=Sinorhizobium TaxID=28105 RepID=I3X8T5_SINF2|nr:MULTISPECIES: cupin domain-containing protein [Sinorhizobium]AFL52291.1 cupin 2, conserved barrel domain protein [Sinorhizobium fredii USDA 257]WEX74681.1 cupin domain-containing protein [Sinorhizobium numidicum]WEX80673.1 cupin domain-containing protein [Sinorhizobium numidicum]
MKSIPLMVLLSATVGFGTLSVAAEDGAKVTPLMTKDLPDYPGKEGLMLSVEYQPGGSSPIHRHDANAFVYVLEGAIVMQVKGGEEVTVAAGETYYENPSDIHLISRNASKTNSAKFIVVLLKKKDTPAVIPLE